VSTSTGISGCYQPHRQTAMPGQKSIYKTFLDYLYFIVIFAGSQLWQAVQAMAVRLDQLYPAPLKKKRDKTRNLKKSLLGIK
jgi:hypothetical protein